MQQQHWMDPLKKSSTQPLAGSFGWKILTSANFIPSDQASRLRLQKLATLLTIASKYQTTHTTQCNWLLKGWLADCQSYGFSFLPWEIIDCHQDEILISVLALSIRKSTLTTTIKTHQHGKPSLLHWLFSLNDNSTSPALFLFWNFPSLKSIWAPGNASRIASNQTLLKSLSPVQQEHPATNVMSGAKVCKLLKLLWHRNSSVLLNHLG